MRSKRKSELAIIRRTNGYRFNELLHGERCKQRKVEAEESSRFESMLTLFFSRRKTKINCALAVFWLSSGANFPNFWDQILVKFGKNVNLKKISRKIKKLSSQKVLSETKSSRLFLLARFIRKIGFRIKSRIDG